MSQPSTEQTTPPPGELASLLTALQTEVIALKAQNASLQETLVNLSHDNEMLRRRIYGNRTERGNTSELQLTLGDLLDADKRLQKELDDAVDGARSDSTEDAEGDDDSPPSGNPERQRRGRRDLRVSGLPRVVVELLDDRLEKTTKRIGFDDSLQLMYRPGGFAVLVKRVAKYEVPGPTGNTVLGVEMPKTLFPRGILHSSVIAHIITQKFALGVPHHRFEQYLESQLCQIDRSTMCRYVEEAGGTLGATLVNAMWRDALDNACIISTDATSAMIQPPKDGGSLRQSCKKGHFFTAVVDCQYVLFAYAEKHNQDFVKKLFAGFSGYLQGDASSVYDILGRGPPCNTDEGVILVGCWAHCRRYFFEAALCRYPVGVQGLMRIRAIYAADDALQKLPPAKRRAMRDKHVRPLMDAFFDWVASATASTEGRNLATKALGYASRQEQELRQVLRDPKLPLDNTRSERALRKVVVGRKAWMFYGSDVHAESAAALFSIIATCRLHAIDPEPYLDTVLRLLPYWPAERYLELSPHRWAETRAKLDPEELARPVGTFTIPT